MGAANFQSPIVPGEAISSPELDSLSRTRLEAMRAAAAEIAECLRVLSKGGLNVVGEVLRGQSAFVEYDHYPDSDVFDPDTHSQYYYHAHRGLAGEHGHFHTFMRAAGMPARAAPVAWEHAEPWPGGDEALAHLIAVSMDAFGLPIGLFAPNRWVAGDTWYDAEQVIRMLEEFRIDHANPSWPVNRWISAMFVLFRPHIEALLRERDRIIETWRDAHPGEDVLEMRELEVLAWMPISVDAALADVERVLARRPSWGLLV